MSGDVDCSRFLNTLKDAESLRSQWQGASWEELKQCALSNAERIVSVDRTERTEGKSALANQTREWVVLPDEEKIPSIKGDQGLLRMYQNYIVTLTRQVDVTESAFLKVYKLLDALPDPAQPLAALAEQAPCVSKLAEDNATLRERAASLEQIVASHQQELSELQNQEVTVNQLKEDLRAAKIESQAALDRASEERAAAWDVEREVLLDEVRGREESLTRQLAAQVSERTQQQQLNDAVQDELLTMQGRMSEVLSGQDISESMLKQETESFHLRIAELQSENGLLQKKLQNSAPMCELEEANSAVSGWESRCAGFMAQLAAAEQQHASDVEEREKLASLLRLSKDACENLTATVATQKEELRSERQLVHHGHADTKTPNDDPFLLRRELEEKNSYIRSMQQRVERMEADEMLATKTPAKKRSAPMSPQHLEGTLVGPTPVDRFVASFTRFLHNNRLPRLFFAVYFVFLHVLLFTTTYRLTGEMHNSTILRYPHRYHGTAKF